MRHGIIQELDLNWAVVGHDVLVRALIGFGTGLVNSKMGTDVLNFFKLYFWLKFYLISLVIVLSTN